MTIDCPVVLRAPQLPVGGSAWFDVALRVLDHGWRGAGHDARQVAIGLNHLGHNLAIAGALATAAELGPTPPAADDCPGVGRCHGCASWCDRCGDVAAVCHSGSCERHHCSDCHTDVTSSEEIVEGAGWCTACQDAAKGAMTRYRVVTGADLVAGQWCARFGDRTEDPIGGLTVADLEEDLAAGVDFALYDWEHFDPAMHRRSVVAFIIVGDAPAPDAACPCDSCAARDWENSPP